MKKIILIGMGGHAKSIIDSIEKRDEYQIIGYTDIVERCTYRGYKYLGNDSVLKEYYKMGIKNAFISIGYLGGEDVRSDIYKMIKEIGFSLPTIIDPSALLAEDTIIGEGVYIGKKCVINSDVKIGKLCIINTGAIIEHECNIGDFSHISVGSILCGEVKVGESVFVGANATVIQGKCVGNKCIIGAGTTINKNVEDEHKVKNSRMITISKIEGDNK